MVKNKANIVNEDLSNKTKSVQYMTSTTKKRRLVDMGSVVEQSSSKRRRQNSVNRVHWRVILGDVGTRIDKENSLDILLKSISQCITAHEKLLESNIHGVFGVWFSQEVGHGTEKGRIIGRITG